MQITSGGLVEKALEVPEGVGRKKVVDLQGGEKRTTSSSIWQSSSKWEVGWYRQETGSSS